MIQPVFFFHPNGYAQQKACIALLCMLLLATTNSFGQTKTGPKATGTQVSPQSSFVMCEVMPGSEVAAKVPYSIPFKSVEAWPTASIKTGCKYIFKSEDDQAFVAIGLTDLGSDKNAFTSYKNTYKASKDLWEEEPAMVIVLQDTGYFSGKDECGLRFHLGNYILDINFKGQFPDVTDIQKKEAGILLARLVIERLQALWIKKPA